MTGPDRRAVVITERTFSVVRFHHRSFHFLAFSLKLVDLDELLRTPPNQPCIWTNDQVYLILRRWTPSLLDAFYDGIPVTSSTPPNRSPGDVGPDGYAWDFESEPTMEEVTLGNQIWAACRARDGHTTEFHLYDMHAVSGDPYRKDGVLYNTRFGDIPYLTPGDTADPLHAAMCFGRGAFISDGKKILGRTCGNNDGLLLPTIPKTILDEFDEEAPTYYTKHVTEQAAIDDLAKFELNKHGLFIPQVFNIVRRFVLSHVGCHPSTQRPSTLPIRDSAAGVNGDKFRTKEIQAHPHIDALSALAVKQHWQMVTPVTLKRQYCSKPKTRTILGTASFAGLPIRAALHNVTKAWMKCGEASPIYLGKNKFKPLSSDWAPPYLNADLASCDRSTPSVVRHFATNLLFEQADAREMIPLYVINCCHDVIATGDLAATKRGGLSSGDPVTSISNTIYSCCLYVQHMFLHGIENGLPFGRAIAMDEITFEELLQIQGMAVYSDDVVLHTPVVNTYESWNAHLSLSLCFQTDPKKTEIGPSASFLGCRLIGRQLVPLRDRVMAALCYHVSARNNFEYYASASAVLLDSSACTVYDTKWFHQLVERVGKCAAADGFKFPNFEWYAAMFARLSTEGLRGVSMCAQCGSKSCAQTLCGQRLCALHCYCHQHCPTMLDYCGHNVNGQEHCSVCDLPVGRTRDANVAQLEEDYPYEPVVHDVVVQHGKVDLKPGAYRTSGGKLVMARNSPDGVLVDLPDGPRRLVFVPNSWTDINWPNAIRHAGRSNLVIGPPGTGKSTFILASVTDQDSLIVPTRALLEEYASTGRFNHNYPDLPRSAGPWLSLAAHFHRVGHVFIDEACFVNPLDLARILTCGPATLVGDDRQLPPVGTSGPCFLLRYMQRSQLTVVYRFSQNLVDVISPLYDHRLTSECPHQTQVTFGKLRADFPGVTITPYHRDRVCDAVTVDSQQGKTHDCVQLYLPTPASLTCARALVAISRARRWLHICDPHKQLAQFFDMSSLVEQEGYPFYDGTERPSGWCPLIDSDGYYGAVDINTLPDGHPILVRKGVAPPERLLPIYVEGQQLSCLPQVANNLGFWFSPDLPCFHLIVPELCRHWPVVTAINNERWPTRLVVTLKPLHKLSAPAMCAGFLVGTDVFLGSPGVVSYFLTFYENGVPQRLELGLMSTGRIYSNRRHYLDDAERDFAEAHYHAFVGEDVKSVVGGCHHITSKFLPTDLPIASVVKVGVASPGKAVKACCTITDVYLPLLAPYLDVVTPSKVMRVVVDARVYRLMVWKDKTCYVQLEGARELATYLRTVDLPSGVRCFIDLPDVKTDACLGSREVHDVYIGPYGDSTNAAQSICTVPLTDNSHLLVNCVPFNTGVTVYHYKRVGEDPLNYARNVGKSWIAHKRRPLAPKETNFIHLVNG